LLKPYVAPIRFQTPSRTFEIIVDPDEIGEVPEGLSRRRRDRGQAIPAWKHQSAKPAPLRSGVPAYLRDEFGQARFYLFDEKTSDIWTSTLAETRLAGGFRCGNPHPECHSDDGFHPDPDAARFGAGRCDITDDPDCAGGSRGNLCW
jgi:hypothetical protein